MKIGVLGSGTWGTALARLLCNNGHTVTLYSVIKEEIELLDATREHPNLKGTVLPKEIVMTNDIKSAITGMDFVLFAVPSVYVRATAESAKRFISRKQILIDVAKGIEEETMFTMSEIIHDVIPGSPVVVLSGPTHAEEVAKDLPTTIVAACEDSDYAKQVANLFYNSSMRAYINTDARGVELCGALKNVIALSAGISTGLGYGDNSKAALITRGMSEIRRLGVAMGCMEQTFSGLAGIGDLIVTATSEHSRNNRCGQLIGQGMSVEEAKAQVGMVVEGIYALKAAVKLGELYRVQMNIIDGIDRIVNGGVDPRVVVDELMSKPAVYELDKPELNLIYENSIIKNIGESGMKRVITYGTFDLLHYGHINLLKRAKALGDYLVVCLSTDEFNWNEKQKKCYFTYEQRKALLESIRYVDLVIPEENWEQKKTDIHDYKIDTFVMGDDWRGKFDFLKEEGCEVVYLPRTPEISTTQIKQDLHK